MWVMPGSGRCETVTSPFTVLWCNGSTQVFGAYSPGSNPGRTTIIDGEITGNW